MTAIVVCSLSRLDETVASSGAREAVSLLAPGTGFTRPSAIAADRHLSLSFHDIAEPEDGLVMATGAHVDALIAFIDAWDRRTPLLIHCWAGVSRSTAAAFIALCRLAPDVAEADHAARLRRASPTATPNRHLVALGDEVLARSGRMVAAAERIGRGAETMEGAPFTLPLSSIGR